MRAYNSMQCECQAWCQVKVGPIHWNGKLEAIPTLTTRFHSLAIHSALLEETLRLAWLGGGAMTEFRFGPHAGPRYRHYVIF
jgi:hypothetical protein